eukprot:Opistho-2@77391
MERRVAPVAGGDDDDVPAYTQYHDLDNVNPSATHLLAHHDGAPTPRAVPLRLIGASCCLFGLVVIWVSMGELMAKVQETFEKPFFLTWMVHNFYLVFLLPWVFLERSVRRREKQRRHAAREVHPVLPLWREYLPHLKRALILNTLLFACVLTWYISLTRTSLSVNTGIYNSSPAFVFILSALILKEKVGPAKSLAVALSVGGVVLVAVSSKPAKDGPQTTPIGCALVVASAALYALYEVMGHPSADPSHKNGGEKAGHVDGEGAIGDDDVAAAKAAAAPAHAHGESSEALTVSCGLIRTVALMGVFNALLFPGLFVCDAAGWERMEWPTGDILMRICIAGVCDSVFNCLLLGGILLSSPLFISVGSMLTIPGSMVSDRILHGYVMPLQAMGGVLLIFAGFIILVAHAHIDRWLSSFVARVRSRGPSAGYEPLGAKTDDD